MSRGAPDPFDAVVCVRCGRIAPELPPEWEDVGDEDEALVCEKCLLPDERQAIADSMPYPERDERGRFTGRVDPESE